MSEGHDNGLACFGASCWDGSVSSPPAGWYPDTQQPGQQRYWDGQRWTEHVQVVPLFDAMLTLGTLRTKLRRMVVTPEELWWGDEHVRWDEVTWFSQVTQTVSGGAVQYALHLQCGDRAVVVIFGARVKRQPIGTQAYQVILEQLKRTIGTRVLTGLIRMVDAGEIVRVGGLVLSPAGFATDTKDGEVHPWTVYAGVEVTGIDVPFIEIFRVREDGKRKRACRVQIDMLRGWVIPPVVEEHARRYGHI